METKHLSLDQQLRQELEQIATTGLLRTLLSVQGVQGPRMTINGRSVLEVSSSNYLGLAGDPRVIAAAAQALREFGCSSGGARLICGNVQIHEELERELAQFLGYESALLFSTGYMANLGLITALVQDGDVILSDSLNHASIIDASRMTRATILIYRHNDLQDLSRLAKSASGYRRRFLIVDGVFSMDGDTADVESLRSIADHHDLHLIVDDAHGIGVLGRDGRGVSCGNTGDAPLAEVVVGNLGKAFGSFGAFVACSQTVRDYLLNKSRPFIFTCGLAPALSGAALAAARISRAEPHRRTEVLRLAQHLRTGLSQSGFDTLEGNSQIVPVIVGENEETIRIANAALEQGIHIQGIRYPSVPNGKARLRIVPNYGHTTEDMDQIIDVLARLRAPRIDCRVPKELQSKAPDHVIHLRGPWWVHGFDDRGKSTSQKVTFPAAHSDLVDLCPVPHRISRNFGRPSGLGPETKVVLCIDRPNFAALVTLNEVLLTDQIEAGENFSLDVSLQLRERNTLIVEWRNAPNRKGLNVVPEPARLASPVIADVRLEIFDNPKSKTQ